jgi:peptide/nickel transport system permease protein
MSQAAGTLGETSVEQMRKKPLPFYVDVLRRLIKEKPLGLIGLVIAVVFLVMAVAGPTIAPNDPTELRAGPRLEGPTMSNLMGTDPLGRDIFSRVIHGARVSVIISGLAVAIAAVISLLIGLVSGYFGGLFDLLSQRLVDAFLAFPALVFLIAVGAMFMGWDAPGLPTSGVWQTTNVLFCIALGILFGVGQSRVVRSAVLTVAALTYMEAARATGAGHTRMIFKHVMPNVMAPLITLATLNIGNAILIEATLSFLGLGAPPDLPTWGNMLNQARVQLGQGAWWLAFFPGLALSMVVFAFNMLGDALRDLLDPRLRTGA